MTSGSPTTSQAKKSPTSATISARPTGCHVFQKMRSFSSSKKAGSVYQREGIVEALARSLAGLKSPKLRFTFAPFLAECELIAQVNVATRLMDRQKCNRQSFEIDILCDLQRFLVINGG